MDAINKLKCEIGDRSEMLSGWIKSREERKCIDHSYTLLLNELEFLNDIKKYIDEILEFFEAFERGANEF